MYVVKLYGDQLLKERSLAREVFGSLLARVLGLNTPPIAIVRVLPELGARHPDPRVTQRIQRSSGWNFGSQMIQPTFPYNGVSAGLMQSAAEIFAFDLLIQNPDRRSAKPNVLETSSGFAVIDHEMAFPYASPSMVLGPISEVWEIGRTEPVVHGHLFYPHLKGKAAGVDFGPFLDRLEAVTDVVLAGIEAGIPERWRTDEVGRIQDFLRRARSQVGLIHRMLYEVLA